MSHLFRTRWRGHDVAIDNRRKFLVQPKFVELETELALAVERVLLIPSLNFYGAVGPNSFNFMSWSVDKSNKKLT